MSESIIQILNPANERQKETLFPHAPEGWTSADAEKQADVEGIKLEEVHWQIIIGLQEYYAKHSKVHIRELHDAMDEKFHEEGGLKYLYRVLPQGPIAQGCRLAGLHAPADTVSNAYGSVQ